MRVGILTGGGDCPGLNAVIRAVVTKGERQYGDEVVGFRNGWAGVMEGDLMPLSAADCHDILPLGGTILGTSRANPYATEGGAGAVRATLERERINALIAVGGDDTLTVAGRLASEGATVIGVPKDHRQRPRRHRAHLWLPHCRADRHRGHRPPAHDRRGPTTASWSSR